MWVKLTKEDVKDTIDLFNEAADMYYGGSVTERIYEITAKIEAAQEGVWLPLDEEVALSGYEGFDEYGLQLPETADRAQRAIERIRAAQGLVRTDLPSVDDMVGIVELDKPCTEYGETYKPDEFYRVPTVPQVEEALRWLRGACREDQRPSTLDNCIEAFEELIGNRKRNEPEEGTDDNS